MVEVISVKLKGTSLGAREVELNGLLIKRALANAATAASAVAFTVFLVSGMYRNWLGVLLPEPISEYLGAFLLLAAFWGAGFACEFAFNRTIRKQYSLLSPGG